MAVIKAHLRGEEEDDWIFVELPTGEKNVLSLLADQTLTVPQIAKKQTNNPMSHATLYGLLNRLEVKGFVDKVSSDTILFGTNQHRVTFTCIFDVFEEVPAISEFKK